MRITNMLSDNGNPVPNQFIITAPNGMEFFQSYDTIIAAAEPGWPLQISRAGCDYSQTTTKYLRRFLGYNAGEGEGSTRKIVKDLAATGRADIVEPGDLKELFSQQTMSSNCIA